MTIHKNNTNIYSVYKGNTSIYRIYKGSTLIFGYTPNKTIFESSTPGTYKLTIGRTGLYDVYVIGSGGGAGGGSTQSSHKHAGNGGGGGAGFIGRLSLTGGVYDVAVGKGGAGGAANSKGSDGTASYISLNSKAVVTANGGGGASAARADPASGNYGGSIYTDDTKVVSYSLKSKGNEGGRSDRYDCPPGASLYNGYGKGGTGVYAAKGNNGAGGYVKIIAV